MFLAKFAFFIALWLCLFNFGYIEPREVSGDAGPAQTACANCTICPYPCHPLPPPPPSSPSGLPSYEVPPPPIQVAQGNCPPAPAVQCCYYPPPTPYGYVPYDSNFAAYPLCSSFLSAKILLFSFAVLF